MALTDRKFHKIGLNVIRLTIYGIKSESSHVVQIKILLLFISNQIRMDCFESQKRPFYHPPCNRSGILSKKRGVSL